MSIKIASCAMPVMAGMRVNTKSDKTRIARGGVMEFLLANHPLDCPICDQGGECDLQDISHNYGYGESRMHEYKRGVEDKAVGPLIKTTMTRCIHCTRCIRFTEEVAGDFSLGTTGRGRATEVGTYVENLAASELSSNVVDLCPVGALTNKPYAFKARPWELKSVPSIDILDTILPTIQVDSRGIEVMRVLPRINEDVNEEWLGDKSRHALDGNKRQRLTTPLIKKNGVHTDVSWDYILEQTTKAFQEVNPEDIQVLIGEHTDLETICSIRDLMNRLDVDNVSLGNHSLKVDNTTRSGYLMNSKIRGIDDCDLLLMVGTNPRYESPVLNARIRKAVNKHNLPVGLIGSPYDLTYNYTHIGNTTKSLVDIINGTHPFCSKIARAKLPMLLIGSEVVRADDGKELYKALLSLAKQGGFINEKQKWNGFNILHNQVSTIGALDLGIKPYVKTSSKAKLVVLLGYDSFEKQDISDDAKVIYIGSHGNVGSERADIILPGATYFEKNGTYVSTEGRVEVTRKCLPPPFLAREDWEIIRALSECLDATLPYDDVFEVRNRLAELAPHLVKYNVPESSSFAEKIYNKYSEQDISLKNRVFEDAVDVSFIFNINFIFCYIELLHD